jgi:hypothetical protein
MFARGEVEKVDGKVVCGSPCVARGAARGCRSASGRAASPSLFFLVLCSQQLELVFVLSGSLALFDITEH